MHHRGEQGPRQTAARYLTAKGSSGYHHLCYRYSKLYYATYRSDFATQHRGVSPPAMSILFAVRSLRSNLPIFWAKSTYKKQRKFRFENVFRTRISAKRETEHGLRQTSSNKIMQTCKSHSNSRFRTPGSMDYSR